jgi:predicted nucleic acid-binding protein
MVEDLIDTTVLVDLARSDPRAIGFMDASDAPRVCPDVCVAEMLLGVRSRAEIRAVATTIREWFSVAFHGESDARRALDLLQIYRPSHGVGYLDCLIAAMAIHRGLTVHSHNLKHMSPIRGLKVVRPY